MNKNPSLAMLSLTMLFALTVSAIFTAPVLADGGTTPPTPPPSGGSARNSHPSSNNLSNVPSGTKVVIVDSNGNKLPLGSQAAQEIVNSGDPVWCPTSVATPTNGGSCSPEGASLATLITWLNTNDPNVSGTIWIENSYDRTIADSSSTSFSLDGSTLSLANAAANDLTIKGGWNGPGTNTITGVTTISGATLSITNWTGNVFVNDIVIQNPPIDGLTVKTSKNITLNSVQSNGSIGGMGANLNNTSGTGTVTISNSEFDANKGIGLNVVSHGAITVSNLIADNGLGRAVILDNCAEAVHGTAPCTTSTAQAVTVSGINQINGNALYGLEIDSTGAITVNSLSANANLNGYGLYLDNHLATSAQKVSLTGTNIFNNDYSGLEIHSIGAIAVNSVTADSSVNGNGAYLENCDYTGSCTAPGAQTVTLTGTNAFNGNAGGGLYIYSNGQITDSGLSLTADGNIGPGAVLRNDYPPATAGVTVSGTGEFNGNGLGFGDGGLIIDSRGAILLSTTTIHANGNGGSGLYLNNGASTSGTVTIGGVNQFNGNFLNGLEVLSNGNITANDLNAGGNGIGYDGITYDYQTSGGVFLSNDSSTGIPTVTITGNNTFTDNYESGLVVESHGNITTNNLNASGNGLKGAVAYKNWTGATLTTLTTVYPVHLPKLVTVNGTNIFNNNLDDGLFIETSSAITTNNLTANGNNVGAYIDNCFYTGISSCQVTTAEAVTLNGTNTFNNSGLDGLDVYSYGNIKAASLNASGDGANGVWLQNDFSNSVALPLLPQPSKGTVTLTGTSTFNDNSNDGLDVTSDGAIKASYLSAFNNPNYGALLDNHFAATAQAVTLTNTNAFSYNGSDGLDVYSKGAISLSTLTTNFNGGLGAYLFNVYTGFKSVVTLTGSSTFSHNASSGLQVDSNGAITLSSMLADGNTGNDGVLLDNCNELVLGTPPCLTATQNVTLTGNDVFTNNNNKGLEIYSSGVITLNTTTLNSSTNGSGGVALDNSGASTSKAVTTLKGTYFFNQNGGVQLSVLSKGGITAGNITALNNTFGTGVSLINDTTHVAGAMGGVVLSGTNVFKGNTNAGLSIQSSGAITVNNITANGNGHQGILLDNSTGTAQTISLTGATFANDNGTSGSFDGIDLSSKGLIKANSVTALGNTMNGANFDNHQGASAATVTVTGTNFFDNNTGGGGLLINSNGAVTLSGANFFDNNAGGDGLLVTTSGAVTLSKITANFNGADGLNITTPLTLALTCGSFLSNAGYGINLATTGTATINGTALFGNGSGDTIHQTGGGAVLPLVPLPCTLP